MTRADSDPSGDAQSVPEPVDAVVVPARVRFWSVAPKSRTAPTPTPVATAAASACLRVNARRRALAGTGATWDSSVTGDTAMPPVNQPSGQPESARCEE